MEFGKIRYYFFNVKRNLTLFFKAFSAAQAHQAIPQSGVAANTVLRLPYLSNYILIKVKVN